MNFLNHRYLFIENPIKQFVNCLSYHNMVINYLNESPLITLGQNNLVFQFFNKRDYFWVGADFVGPPFELLDQKMLFYDMINRKSCRVTCNINKTMLTIDEIFSIYDEQFEYYSKNNEDILDNTSFQLIISEETKLLSSNFIFFNKLI